MTFEEQIRQTFDTLTVQLRDEVSRQLQAAVERVTRAALDRDISVVGPAGKRDGGDHGVHAGHMARADEGDRAGEPRYIDEIADRIAAQRTADGLERIADAVRTIDDARTLADVLDALATCAARDLARVAVLVTSGGELRPWRLIGFGPLDGREHGLPASWATAGAQTAFACSFEEAGVIAEAVGGGLPVTGPNTPAFAALPTGEEAFAAPLVLGGEVVAVLYADQGATGNEMPRPQGENDRWRSQRATEHDARRPIHTAAASQPGVPRVARKTDDVTPRAMREAKQIEALDAFRSEVLDAVPHPMVEPIPSRMLEVMTRHASRCLESIVAFKTARAFVAANGSSKTARTGARAAQPPNRQDANGEDDDAARRYARLLVSEIKLYYEPEVETGRRERDLATRLGGEIARARRLYEERVPAEVRRRADYFHDELVRTLAEGDATLLQLT